MKVTKWIPYPLRLTGQIVDLISLDTNHFPALRMLAKNKKIWEYYAYDASVPEKFEEILVLALEEMEKGTQLPFVVYHKAENKLIGSTRFIDIQSKHRKLEIGTTWLDPVYWGTAVNLECKLLLLTFAFETLKALRVQLTTDELNLRSRKAIEKIGGQFEGILRNDKIRDNNTKRNSAYYSILDEEWNEKKARLASLLENKLVSG